MVEKHAVVLISFTAREKVSDKIIDTTDEATAKKAGMYTAKQAYGPQAVVVGNKEVLPGVDEALLAMKEKESRTVDVPPSKGFGERNPELVRVLPLQEFKARNLVPVPGMVVDANGYYGRVQSVSGGRVRVDFNPELAGKELLYELTLEKMISFPQEKLEAFKNKFFEKAKAAISLANGKATIALDVNGAMPHPEAKFAFTRAVLSFIPEVKSVQFTEEFTKAFFDRKPKAAHGEPGHEHADGEADEASEESEDTEE